MIRMAIIGCGGMTGSHMLKIGEVISRFKITAVADIVEERARKTASLFAGCRAARDYRDILDETDGRASLQGLRVIWRLYDSERNGTVADLRGLGLNDFK